MLVIIYMSFGNQSTRIHDICASAIFQTEEDTWLVMGTCTRKPENRRVNLKTWEGKTRFYWYRPNSDPTRTQLEPNLNEPITTLDLDIWIIHQIVNDLLTTMMLRYFYYYIYEKTLICVSESIISFECCTMKTFSHYYSVILSLRCIKANIIVIEIKI